MCNLLTDNVSLMTTNELFIAQHLYNKQQQQQHNWNSFQIDTHSSLLMLHILLVSLTTTTCSPTNSLQTRLTTKATYRLSK